MPRRRRKRQKRVIVAKRKYKLFLCPDCDRVWEVYVDNSRLKLTYYKDFPKYGQEIEVCPRCEDKREKKAKNGKRLLLQEEN